MSFKQTTINSSFFPHRHSGAGQNSAQYQTEDADLASDSNAPIDGHSGLRAGGANGGDAPQVPTSAFAPAQARGNESKSKPNLFARKSSKNLAGAQELPPKVLENAEEGKIILVVFEVSLPRCSPPKTHTLSWQRSHGQ